MLRNTILGIACACFLAGCASTGDFADSPSTVAADTKAAVQDVKAVERGAIALATETAKSLIAILKPITSISDLAIDL